MRRPAFIFLLITASVFGIPLHAQTVAPVSELTCVVSDTDPGVVELSWVLGDDYDTVEVSHYGEVLAEFDADLVEGETLSFSTETMGMPQTPRFEVVGTVSGENSAEARCFAALIPDAIVTGETAPAAPLDFGEPYTSTLDVGEAIIGDIIVDVEISAALPGIPRPRVTIDLESPSGTLVNLLDRRSIPVGGLRDRFWDMVPSGASDLIDRGFLPPAPGNGLYRLAGENTIDPDDPDATWTLTVSAARDEPAVLDSWGISVYQDRPPLPFRTLSCEGGRDPGSVAASGNAGAAYEAVRWFVNGELYEVQELGEPVAAGEPLKFTTEPQPFGETAIVEAQGLMREGRVVLASPLRDCEETPVLPPPQNVSCHASAVNERQYVVSWAVPREVREGYDHFFVFLDDEVGQVIDADVTSYTTPPLLDNTDHRVEIQGVTVDPPGESLRVGCSFRVLEAPELEYCQSPEQPTAETYIIDVDEVASVANLEILLQGTDVTYRRFIEIESPDGTRVGLHRRARFADEVCFLFGDEGELASYIDEEPCPYIRPEGPGKLSDLIGHETEGEWTLHPYTDEGFTYTVSNWCLRFETCETLPPAGLTCTLEEDTAELSWSNGSDYDEVRVYMDGELVETLDGSAESHSIEGVPDRRTRVVVEGHSDDGCTIASHNCWVVPTTTACESDFLLADTPHLRTLELDILDAIVIGDVELMFDASTSDDGPPWIELTSPEGTTVIVDAGSYGVEVERWRVIWSSHDQAERFLGQINRDCGFCRLTPVTDFEELAPRFIGFEDLRGEISDGTWTLLFRHDLTRVHELCLDIHEGCPLAPPSDLICDEENDGVELSWLSFSEYERITVLRNEELIAELDGDATSYSDVRLPPGGYRYRISAHGEDADGEPCESFRECEIEKGIRRFCEYEANGRIGSRSSFLLETTGDFGVEEARVVLSFDHDYLGHYDIEITNPDGETVLLLADADIEWITPGNLDAVFTDSGSPPEVVGYSYGADILPVESLEAITGGSTEGEWELNLTRTWSHFTGSFDEFCVEFYEGCDFERPTIESCGPAAGNGMPPVEIAWTDVADDATEVLILRNGVVIATLDADETQYLDTEVPSGRHEYRVMAATEDCSITSTPCESGPVGILTRCEYLGATVDEGVPVTGSMVFKYPSETFPDGSFVPALDAAEVTVDLDTDDVTSYQVIVESPDSTRVTLYRYAVGEGSGLNVIFRDDAPGPWSAFFLECACPRAPTGPGALADLSGQDPEGEWQLRVETRDAPGTLVSWCVGVQPRTLPAEGPQFLRGDADNNGTVSPVGDALAILEWAFGDRAAPPCMAAADIDNNGSVEAVSDGVRLLTTYFRDGTPIAFPGPEVCGVDPEDPATGGVPEGCDPDGDGVDDDGEGCG